MVELKLKRPELLAPAGNLEKLKIAVLYGADAVYVGGEKYSLRASADNFSISNLKAGIAFAKERGVRIYLALNIFARDEDIEGIRSYLESIAPFGIDAVIVSDYGVFKLVRDEFPSFRIHLSTQANVTNLESVKLWQSLGVDRVTLAREVTLPDLVRIAQNSKIETEVFVHGAICVAYSGRCLLSKYLTGRDSNRGECAQSCRWKYYLVEEERPGEYHPVCEDSNGTYFFNSKDLCLAKHVPDLLEAEIDSFKIEGRMKSINYTATVTRIYREIIDSYRASPANFAFLAKWQEELEKVSHREYTEGFIVNGEEKEIPDSPGYVRLYDFVGLVKEFIPQNQVAKVLTKDCIRKGDILEAFNPDGRTLSFEVEKILNPETSEDLPKTRPNQLVDILSSEELENYAVLRRKVTKGK